MSQVYHMIDSNNQLVQCTFGTDGELSLKNVQKISLGVLPTNILETGRKLQGKIREARKGTQCKY